MDEANLEAILPLNAVQDGILYHTLYAPDSTLYIQQYVADLEGPLDIDRFREAWGLVVDRHQALRSFITWRNRDRPLQIVRKTVEAEWTVVDWRTMPGAAVERSLEQFLKQDRLRRIDLERAPLMRWALIELGSDRAKFVWTHHHTVLDGWSLGLVLDDVLVAYAALLGGEIPFDQPAPQLRGYSAWLRQQSWGEAAAFWSETMPERAATTRLGIEQVTTSPWAEEQHLHRHVLGEASTAAIVEAAKTVGVSQSSMFRAAWALLLSAYTGERLSTFGAAVAGRPPDLPGSLETVGMFINSLPVTVPTEPSTTVAELVHAVQQSHAATTPFEATPLTVVRDALDAEPEDPVFETLLVFENVPEIAPAGGDLVLRNPQYRQESNYPLALLVLPGDEIELQFLYDPARYDEDDVHRLGRQLSQTLASMSANLHEPIGELQIVPSEEAESLVAAQTQPTAELGSPVPEMIALRADSAPDAVAIRFGDASMSYGDLMSRAGDVAAALETVGVREGHLVLIDLPRSMGTVVAMLAVWMAGAAYLPADAEAPEERTRFLREDAGVAAVISDEDSPGVATVVLDEGGQVLRTATGRPLEQLTVESGLAYVMYTSGTTGRPKGVRITHANLAASTMARPLVYGRYPRSFLVVSPLHFDSSVAGLYSTLVGGGTVVLSRVDDEKDVVGLGSLIGRLEVEQTLMLPSLYGLLLEHAPSELRSLSTVIVAGEPCSPSLVHAHRALLPDTRLFNEYGPTEATVWCTVAELSRDGGDDVTIGHGIPGSTVVVLDADQRVAPTGALGELCVFGSGVAAGYLNRPELTDERFPTVDLPGLGRTRVYRTGDLGRYRQDGSLELAGRIDQQVKIRGQRVELGELESVLQQHRDVQHAVAVVVPGPDGRPSGIAAHVEPDGIDQDELIDLARAELPAVLVPRQIVEHERLPRGRTGKIDRRALESLSPESVRPADDYVAPTAGVEQQLAEIWASVLGLDRVGAHDNFFDLGGDSIVTIRIIAKAHQAGLSITPRQFFEQPTVAGLAASLV